MDVSSLMYAILAGILPSFIWLWFWVREDSLHPEPRSLLAGTFAGGMIAVVISIFGEKYVADAITDPSLTYFYWAAIEEIAKLVMVAAIALHTMHNDEPINAMIYCIVAALGFAALENTLFIMGPFSTGEFAQGLLTGNMRFIGATLIHTVSSASVGFFLGLAFYRGFFTKLLALIAGLATAVALHTAFNLSIINSTTIEPLKSFGWIWGAVVLLIILFEEIKAVRPRYSSNLNSLQ